MQALPFTASSALIKKLVLLLGILDGQLLLGLLAQSGIGLTGTGLTATGLTTIALIGTGLKAL